MEVTQLTPTDISAFTIAECEKSFALILRRLLDILKKKATSPAERALVDRCNQRIHTLITTSGSGRLIALSHVKIIALREPITKRDEEYFKGNARSLIGDSGGDSGDSFLNELIQMVQTQYVAAKKAEQDVVYQLFYNMFLICVQYALGGGSR